MTQPHIPVLLDEVVAALAPQPGDVIVDATFGAGGYTRALLAAGATVHAFDRDPDAIAAGEKWPETAENPPRLVLHPRRFSEMVNALADSGLARVDGIVLDIGVSSMQLDQAERGFAFSADGPLDMRMSQEGASAADFLNEADEAGVESGFRQGVDMPDDGDRQNLGADAIIAQLVHRRSRLAAKRPGG